jgi:aldose sugar dehydrogenase
MIPMVSPVETSIRTRAGRPLPRIAAGIPQLALVTLMVFGGTSPLRAQPEPEVVDPNLEVRTAAEGLTTPVSMAFLGPDDFLVLEKNTGRVQRVVGGLVESTVLDLAVNFASERGLLGIALHPEFPVNPGVYLFWTESSTGEDTNVTSETPLLGNRVDRFVWEGGSLQFDQEIIRLRALQPPFPPFEEAERGNHNGGVPRFGPDGKLYIFVGDVGRRGWMQNVAEGFGPDGADDEFGGPEPTDAHLTGVVLRLNDDGTTPEDNPFFQAGIDMLSNGEVGEEVARNIQKIFSYGHRNSFGMAFDPRTGDLWLQENGDDAFSEINRVEPGMNSGWVQIMGPVERIDEYKAVETSAATDPFTGSPYFGLQQNRWSPENIADTPEEALAALFMLPGAHFADPVFSWRFVVEPAGMGFLNGRALGPQYDGDLFLGGARDFLEDGHLFRLKLTGNRRKIAVDDPRLEDRVADNLHKWDITESESLLFGRNFGIVTDIQTGPNGNLFLVALSHGAVYEIARSQPRPRQFAAHLSGDQEVPAVETKAGGRAFFQLSPDGDALTYRLNVSNIENVTQAHIHVGAAGVNGPVAVWLYPPAPPAELIPGRFSGVLSSGTIHADDLVGPLAGQTLATLLQLMRDGGVYVNVHTSRFPAGEIRGQIRPLAAHPASAPTPARIPRERFAVKAHR